MVSSDQDAVLFNPGWDHRFNLLNSLDFRLRLSTGVSKPWGKAVRKCARRLLRLMLRIYYEVMSLRNVI